MALKGTIRDFGVADIFQLVSQQVKTGILRFSNDIDSVGVFFRDGAVVHAESATKHPDRMLGTLLVRAEIMTQGQLDQALIEQQRTLQRLAQVLLDLNYITPATLKEFATLQLTETVYALFEWTDGTYQFDAEPIEPSAESVDPIRAENIVLNGIRLVDEWPSIRERIPSYLWLVERTRDLPSEAGGGSELSEWDFSSIDVDPELADLGAQERRVFELIAPGRTVQKLIDLSRLGEFETCQALSALMQAGFVRVIKPPARLEQNEDEDDSPWSNVPRSFRVAGRVAVSALVIVLGAFLLASTSRNLLGRGQSTLRFRPDPVSARLAQTQIKVIRRALEVYRYQTGSYPLSLDDLVEGRFLRPGATRYPFRQPYFYRVSQAGEVVLLPPVR